MALQVYPTGSNGTAEARQVRGQDPKRFTKEGEKLTPGIGLIAQTMDQDDRWFWPPLRLGIIIEDSFPIAL
jgi:hypothetical protein